MSVQRYTADGYGAQQGEMMPDPEGPWMLAADHARIVAEATAEARAAERRHWEARFRNAEQAHAAALAEERQRVLSMRFTEFMAAIKKSCPCICHEYTRDINPHDGKCVCNGGDGMETLGVAAPRTLTADEWEAIAKQFRMAYQLGSCDPSNCPACDCNMDDEGREQLAGLALQQAQAVIRIIHDGEDR